MGLKPGGDRAAPLRAVLRELDGELRPQRERAVPMHHAADTAHQELTSAAWGPDGALLQASHTEVMRIDPSSLEVLERVSDPAFHNVHSVAPRPAGGLVVTATGTDSVLELNEAHRVVAAHHLGAPPPAGDLRQLHHDALEPHAVHPNHACYVGAERWVTRFVDRCATSSSGRRIPLPEAMPHDGRLRGGWLWFTQVTGRVVAVDPVTLRRELELDVAALSPDPRMPGWCRGIEVVGSRLFVGFTMLRQTRRREVLRLLARGLRGVKRPTRVVEIDLDGPRMVREVELGNAAGGSIYAITAT